MKQHYCPTEKTMITYEGQCNWCDEKEHIGATGTNIKQINHIINLSNQAIGIYNIDQRENPLRDYDIKLHMILTELIVRECARVAGRDVGHFVLKHFGVEQ